MVYRSLPTAYGPLDQRPCIERHGGGMNFPTCTQVYTMTPVELLSSLENRPEYRQFILQPEQSQ